MNSYEKGKKGEDIACRYLENKGYKVIGRNYRKARGEIDIIAKYCHFLVFIEVKCWGTIPVTEAGFSIGTLKRGRIINTARRYVYENCPAVNGLDLRFDLVFIEQASGNVTHMENVIGEF